MEALGRDDRVEETVHVGALVPSPLASRFAAIAKREERSVAAELRQAIRAHVEAHEAEDGAAA